MDRQPGKQTEPLTAVVPAVPFADLGTEVCRALRLLAGRCEPLDAYVGTFPFPGLPDGVRVLCAQLGTRVCFFYAPEVELQRVARGGCAICVGYRELDGVDDVCALLEALTMEQLMSLPATAHDLPVPTRAALWLGKPFLH